MAPRNILQTMGVLFPYTNLLRINEEQELTSNCGGLSAIFAILLVVAILVMKLKQVLDKTTITSTSQATMHLEPPMINISTNMDDPKYFPYMLALGYYQDIHYNSTGTATAQYRLHSGAYSSTNRTLTQIPIALEPCTAAHFKVVPDINTLQDAWGISNWRCLPINRTWEIGGDYELSSLYKCLQLNLTCTYSQNNVDCGYYKLYTLNSFINPTDPKTPSTYYISQDTLLLKNQSYYMYGSKLNQNILQSDQSVTPSVLLNTTTSTESKKIEQKAYMQLAPEHLTILRIEKSGKTTKYTRSYLKLLDVLAYVGGIFSSLLAVFFFLGMYMKFYFEMKFAEYYYNSNDARGISFLSYIKQALFGVLDSTPLKPDWPVEERRISLRETVVKVLDIFFLHKRIAFLQKAITLLLEKHQLKGLQLCQHVTKEQSDDKLRAFRLRDRVMIYLHKYAAATLFGARKDSSDSSEKNDENGVNQTNKMLTRQQDMKRIMHEAEYGQGFMTEVGMMKHQDIVQILEKQVRNIEMDDQQLDEQGLIKEMETDLKQLFEESEGIDGNERSKQICKMLDPWLMQTLKIANRDNLFTSHIIRRNEEGKEKII